MPSDGSILHPPDPHRTFNMSRAISCSGYRRRVVGPRATGSTELLSTGRLELEPRRLLSAYIVDDSSDLPLDSAKGPGETANGTITLRSAIQQVDIDGSGSIGFASPITIMTSGLPTITANGVKIDGGSLGSVVVEGNGDGASGLVFAGDDADIRAWKSSTSAATASMSGRPAPRSAAPRPARATPSSGTFTSALGLGSFGGAALVQGNFIGTDAAGHGRPGKWGAAGFTSAPSATRSAASRRPPAT